MKANLHTNESYFCTHYSPTSSFILFSEPQRCIRHEELLLDRKLVSHKEKKQQNFSQNVLGYVYALMRLRKKKRGTKRFIFFLELKKVEEQHFKVESQNASVQKTEAEMRKGINPLGLPQNFRGHNALNGFIAKWHFYTKTCL